jgi:hypothetical protein
MIWYTAIDYKKYIYALGVQRLDRLHDIGEKFVDEQELGHSIHDELGDMREWLYRAALVDDDEVLAGVRGIPAAMTGDADLNHYSDRRQVATTLRWDGGWYTRLASRRESPQQPAGSGHGAAGLPARLPAAGSHHRARHHRCLR